MGAATIGLAGAIIGGLLVLVGDLVTRRIDRRNAQLDKLRLAAADLIATYLKARSHLILASHAGVATDAGALWPDERQLALARLFTLPRSERLRQSVLEVGAATLAIAEETDVAQLETHFDRQLEAIRRFEAQVRLLGK